MKPAPTHTPAEPARKLEAESPAPRAAEKNLPSETASPDAARQPALEQKFLALNQLSGGIAHEFNNLIAGILGSAELIAMDLPAGHPAHESLRQIFEASNRARDFLQKIRALAQRPPVRRQPVPLQPVIEECLQILRGIIPAKVELESEINPGCPPVNADAAQIQQALLDVCLYCWHGLHERSGHIKVTLDNCRLTKNFSPALPPGPHVRLTVRDNSPGLDRHARERIFDPFHTRKAAAKKIGLELFLVRELIHAHHGEITVESEPGAGLAFHIYLPVA